MPAILKSRLSEIARELAPKVDGAIEDGAEDVAKVAAVLAPYDQSKSPGEPHLKDAIHVERRGLLEWAVVAGNKDVFYGHLVEHGSAVGGRGRPPQPPHPFLVPALEANLANIEARVEEALRDG